ncbi:MAG: 3,4-dihydroxy-2-butanone-4-phosphate synthase [Rhizobiales bacterium]|nr:3,4-dihydroxy-2-butanone-4-phosphate synthase [Hyphomicrobiales bacterium]
MLGGCAGIAHLLVIERKCQALRHHQVVRLIADRQLIAQPGGVLTRASLRSSIDLAQLAGAGDAAVICSIMRDDGEMARIDDIGDLIAAHGLAVADIGALIARLERADA